MSAKRTRASLPLGTTFGWSSQAILLLTLTTVAWQSLHAAAVPLRPAGPGNEPSRPSGCREEARPSRLPGLAAGDVDGDGDLDVCLTAVGPNGEHRALAERWFRPVYFGATVAERGVAPCLGDVDNDGDLDLWLGRRGRRSAAGERREGPTETASRRDTRRVRRSDSRGAPRRCRQRRRSGLVGVPAGRGGACRRPPRRPPAASTTTTATERLPTWRRIGLGLAETPVAAVVCDDFDNDRDLDLLLFFAGDQPPVGWVNDRVGSYHAWTRPPPVAGRTRAERTSGDPTRTAIAICWSSPSRAYVCTSITAGSASRSSRASPPARAAGRHRRPVRRHGQRRRPGPRDRRRPARRDGSRGPALLLNDWPRDELRGRRRRPIRATCWPRSGPTGDASCVAADFTGDGRCDVLLAPGDGKPLLIENATPGGHWIELDLRGTRTDRTTRPARTTRRSAPGSRSRRAPCSSSSSSAAVRAGRHAAAADPRRPGREHHRSIGCGSSGRTRCCRRSWNCRPTVSDGRRDCSARRRPARTCSPGTATQFEFVADFGGVGGLGYLVAPGEYAAPDPTEYLPLPQLEPRDGEYVLQCVTPLEEVTYFDEAKLLAVDHPRGNRGLPARDDGGRGAAARVRGLLLSRPIEPGAGRRPPRRRRDGAVRAIDRRYAGATRPDRRLPRAGRASTSSSWISAIGSQQRRAGRPIDPRSCTAGSSTATRRPISPPARPACGARRRPSRCCATAVGRAAPRGRLSGGPATTR